LIYPGDVIILDLSGATPRLRLEGVPDGGLSRWYGYELQVSKLEPRMRSSAFSGAIPTIQAKDIDAILSRPLVVVTHSLALGAENRRRPREPSRLECQRHGLRRRPAAEQGQLLERVPARPLFSGSGHERNAGPRSGLRGRRRGRVLRTGFSATYRPRPSGNQQ